MSDEVEDLKRRLKAIEDYLFGAGGSAPERDAPVNDTIDEILDILEDLADAIRVNAVSEFSRDDWLGSDDVGPRQEELIQKLEAVKAKIQRLRGGNDDVQSPWNV